MAAPAQGGIRVAWVVRVRPATRAVRLMDTITLTLLQPQVGRILGFNADNRGVRDVPSMDELLKEMEAYRKKYERGSKTWSFLLYFSTIVIATSSAIAGALPKFGDSNALENTALVLGIVGAIVATLTSQIRFGHKRAANRIARMEIELLVIDVQHAGVTERVAAQRLSESVKKQSMSVTGPLDDDDADTSKD